MERQKAEKAETLAGVNLAHDWFREASTHSWNTSDDFVKAATSASVGWDWAAAVPASASAANPIKTMAFRIVVISAP
jgi:hypothetical protein